jgi:hypothetical protein
MNRDVWLAIPSASVERCCASLPAWRERGYRIAVLQNRERGDIPADVVVWRDAYPGWAASVNLLCRTVVPGDAPVVVTGGDDMLPDPDHSAGELLTQFLERFPDTFGVMQPTGDPFMNAAEYCGSPWMGRAWIDSAYRGNGPMHAGYRHNWADHELFHVAQGLGALWTRPDLCQHHAHFSRTNEAPPAYWTQQVAAHDEADVKHFIARRWLGFPGHEPSDGRPTPGSDWFAAQPPGVAERYWLSRYGAATLCDGPAAQLASALRECAARGLDRVALYGCGTELRAAASALLDTPSRILCVIDDHRCAPGARFCNAPIVPIDAVPTAGPDAPQAIVITSRQHQDAIARRCAAHARAGVAVLAMRGRALNAAA